MITQLRWISRVLEPFLLIPEAGMEFFPGILIMEICREAVEEICVQLDFSSFETLPVAIRGTV